MTEMEMEASLPMELGMPESMNDSSQISLRQYVDMRLGEQGIAVRALADRTTEIAQIHEKAHDREHQQQDLAATKFGEALDRRLYAMNEFRQQITHERGLYITKDELLRLEEGLVLRISRNAEDVQKMQNWSANIQGRMWAMGAALTLLISLIGLMLVFTR